MVNCISSRAKPKSFAFINVSLTVTSVVSADFLAVRTWVNLIFELESSMDLPNNTLLFCWLFSANNCNCPIVFTLLILLVSSSKSIKLFLITMLSIFREGHTGAACAGLEPVFLFCKSSLKFNSSVYSLSISKLIVFKSRLFTLMVKSFTLIRVKLPVLLSSILKRTFFKTSSSNERSMRVVSLLVVVSDLLLNASTINW